MKRFIRLLAVTALLGALVLGQAQAAGIKHVIVMISDGCGFNHVQAACLYHFGKPEGWAYQQFPVKMAMSHFPAGGSYDPAQAWSDFQYVKKGPTDSAASATALACGVKTTNGMLGMTPDKTPVEDVTERARKHGMATGVVTTVELCDATPAGFLTHNESRVNHAAIAQSMADSGAQVIMGACNPDYDNNGKLRETPKYDWIGQELWDKLKAGTAASAVTPGGQPQAWKLLQSKDEFRSLLTGPVPDRVFGVAQTGTTLQIGREGDGKAAAYAVPFNANVPNLTDMALGAIRVLDKNPKGFCMMIEGGAIDWAGHSNLSGREIEEEIDFSEAVEAVVKWVDTNSNWDETLLIVTGDHETGYLTGPGSDPKWQPLVNNGVGQMPGMEWHSGSHTNSLIPIFAKGNGSGYFTAHVEGQDPGRGPYVDNTDVAKAVFAALGD